MVIEKKIGNLSAIDAADRNIDRLPLEWFETGKRILHKRTGSGREVVLKFLGEAQYLEQDDVLYADANSLIVVEVLPCDVIVLKPSTMYEMAYACYEIGNKHLPLFFEEDSLLLPYEAPVYRLLQAAGFDLQKVNRKLLHQLRTTVSPHTHRGETRSSLFAKILKRTTSSNE